jgi:hypothetical protein
VVTHYHDSLIFCVGFANFSETLGLRESDDAFDGVPLGWTIECRSEVVGLHLLENGEACCECQTE